MQRLLLLFRLLNIIERKKINYKDYKENIFYVHPSFVISLNNKDKDILFSLQSYFGVGNIKQDLSNDAITYYVNSVKDLNGRSPYNNSFF